MQTHQVVMKVISELAKSGKKKKEEFDLLQKIHSLTDERVIELLTILKQTKEERRKQDGDKECGD